MENQTALITGGTKGIGLAVAQRFAQEGYALLLTYAHDRVRAEAEQLRIEQEYNTTVWLLALDCSDIDAPQKLKWYAEAHALEFDTLVFNAGTTDRTAFPTMNPAIWNGVMQANVNFPVFALQELDSRIRQGASIIFTGSSMGIYPHSVSLVYGVTKSAIHALTRNLVKFYADRRIRVNAVAPGFVDTEWQKEKPTQIRQSVESKIALGAFCSPQELADVYLFIAKNNYINGEIISVDGGYSYR